MKNLVKKLVCLTFVLILTLPICTASAEEWQGYAPSSHTGVVICENLSLRESPNANAKTLIRLSYGASFTVMEHQGVWVGIAYQGKNGQMYNGWVRSEYILEDPQYYTTTGETVIYAYPSTSAKRIGLSTANKSYPIIAQLGDFIVISLRGASGFVYASNPAGPSVTAAPWQPTVTTSPWQPSVTPTGTWPFTSGYNAAVRNPNPSDRLHLRTQPSESAPSLGKYYNGVQVKVSSYVNNEWALVSICGISGYMKRSYLTADASRYPASAMPVMVVANPNPAHNLHLREGQSTSSRSLGLYPNGTEVVVMGVTGEWAHVIINGTTITGYMSLAFLSDDNGWG